MVFGLWSVFVPSAASGAAKPRYGGTLRVAFAQPARTFDPALASTLPERTIARAVYETLTKLDDSGAAAPNLARSWRQEQGGRKWVVELRTGVRVHPAGSSTAASGASLDANTVRISLDRAIQRASSAAAVILRGAQFVCAAGADRLTCDASQPLPSLPEMLADPSLAIATPDGAGTGPWRLVSGSPAGAHLGAFEACWKGRPFLDSVDAEFSVEPRRQRVELELKHADVLALSPVDPRTSAVRLAPPLNLLVLAWPPPAPGTSGHGEIPGEVRRSLASAIRREGLIALLPPGRAEAADGFLPSSLSGYEFLFPPLGGASQPQVGGASQASYRLIYDDSDPTARLMASRLKLDLRVLSATVQIEALPRPAFEESRRRGRYDLLLESVPLRAVPGAALADVLARFELAPVSPGLFLPGDVAVQAQAQFELERTALGEKRAFPLVHCRDAYVLQPGLDQVPVDRDGLLDLANAWKK